MTKLVVLPESDPSSPTLTTVDEAEIGERLREDGVVFERWRLRSLADSADPLVVYRDEIERVCTTDGYVTVDAVRLGGDPGDSAWPAKAAAARAKFLDEHTHDDDEVRFFVEGRGAFYLRLGSSVAVVVCAAGDLLSVPKDTRHWFDMGTNPAFCALRFFRVEDGWVGKFTGDTISSRFPTFDELVAAV